DVTAQYPELQVLPGMLPAPEAVFDGEIIASGDDGRPSVQRLQQRMSLHHPDAVTHALEDLPVQLMIFDILHLGQPVIQLPYTSRRDLLDDLALTGPHIAVPAAWPAPAAQALEQTRAEGYDGVVAKRLLQPLPARTPHPRLDQDPTPDPALRGKTIRPRRPIRQAPAVPHRREHQVHAGGVGQGVGSREGAGQRGPFFVVTPGDKPSGVSPFLHQFVINWLQAGEGNRFAGALCADRGPRPHRRSGHAR
ncbi:hypothetical protein ACFVZH_40115, partial [Streptomyces sp. NPDC059534]